MGIIIKRNIDPDDHYDGTNKIEYIVIHSTGNYTDTDEGNAKFFVSGTRNASAHYFVDEDSITQVVKDKDGAWHVGDGKNKNGINNNNSIGIELCHTNGKISDKTIANAIELVKLKMKEYNIPINKVVRHYDASGKNCPSPFNYNNWEGWTKFKQLLKPPKPPEHYAEQSFQNITKRGIIIHSRDFDKPPTRGDVFVLLDRILNYIDKR